MNVSAPGFWRHLWLLWGLRLSIGLNRGAKNHRALAVAAFVLSSAPGLALGVAFYRLLVWPPVANSSVWSAFLLNLLCFVTTSVWCAWPVLSAGVDDHSELSRYAAFPLSGFRLMLASMLAGLFEPRTLVFYAPLLGAALGYTAGHPPSSGALALALFFAFVLFNAASSRVGLHLVLNVLRRRRSAELIGGFFVLVLVACSFIPPIDTRWLFALDAGVGALPDRVLEDAALALSRVPPGWFGDALVRLHRGEGIEALENLVGLVELTFLTLAVAYGLLLDFHRQVGRGGWGAGLDRASNPFARTRSRWKTLLMREAIDLWHNPRARLLASVPFLLAILLKLLSGRDLFVFLLGATADAWLLGAFCLYGAVVIASTFAQNTFAYDGHGMMVFLSAPVDLGEVLEAKNAVHALAAGGLALAVSGFYRVYFGHGRAVDWACGMAAVAGLLPVLLTAGNFLSLYFPVKFHADLKRRDKLPFAASMLGVAAASVGSAPFVWALRLQGKDGASWTTAGLLAAFALLAWLGYRALLPFAARLLVARRELVLRAVTRD
ncbi:MAG: hypothetical protein ACOZIN_22100 [Myxococcota bacterium]